MIVRRAERKDKEDWAKLRNALWPDELSAHKLDIESFFDLSSVHIVEVFVLDNENDEVVGFIELNIRSHAEGIDARGVPYVEGWFIDSEYRGKGFGKLLLRQAESWAQRQGYQWLASDSDINNHASIACHKAVGFTEMARNVCFAKNLRLHQELKD
ncbi:GCN5-like N-acetyltransferase [Vibrio nigripulchritudo ATCC 27043]|uniref:Aminoglycoside N(6')-acetyltransferase type 1 n=2 Tax=Vibrio nigripulchritudo TaxID=28173 RepID=U4KGS1_9VIBR|nr:MULTISPECIES: GNAT family N-acetyltransferase [Vibrio]EGU60555.1 GCN5-like N-acetyltransferase [Vibrio nigripulchritudo ATCC 27043]KJY74669.1 histone acetyltransferase [Vibrio nigripulchritudo]UAB73992.1 GNAT family N-acetyltransferase [Vibrio sp. SCSIO 43132]CCN34679.1 putative Acyl-CoA N-acyltransferase [Vibrio nigripulchritudo AM115]CCN40014.1 putative Acyl-CoA N-acyltransferase [Vibrio nigripulchritudo FTn2]